MLKIADDKYLTPGDKILRKKLVEIFNVSNQGGITPSNKNKLILLNQNIKLLPMIQRPF